MYLSSIVENSTIDVVVENNLDILRYKRAMYSLKSVAFAYVGQIYDGQVLAVRPHAERGPEAWVVKMAVKRHVEQPARPRLKRHRRADGEFISV